MPQNSLAGPGGIGSASTSPSTGRLRAHSSSCIFRQCCHRVVQEHLDVGRALGHRPGPLWSHPGSPCSQGCWKRRGPGRNLSPLSPILAAKSSVSLSRLSWWRGLRICSPSGIPKGLLQPERRASSLHDAQLCNANPNFSQFSRSRSFTRAQFLQLNAPLPPIREAACREGDLGASFSEPEGHAPLAKVIFLFVGASQGKTSSPGRQHHRCYLFAHAWQ